MTLLSWFWNSFQMSLVLMTLRFLFKVVSNIFLSSLFISILA